MVRNKNVDWTHLGSEQEGYIYIHIYRVSRGECAILRENVPNVKVHRSNPKHLYPKLNGYGVNGEKSVVFLRFHVLYLFRVLLPVHCACPSFSLTAESSTFRLHYQQMSVTVNCNLMLLDIHVPCKVFGILRTTTTLVRVYVV